MIKGKPLIETYSYLTGPIGSSEVYIKNITKALKEVEFDTIVGTGLSGTILLLPLWEELGKDKYVAFVRKHKSPHSFNWIEGSIGERYVVVDDQIETGHTVKEVRQKINHLAISTVCREPQFVGVMEYLSANYV